MVWTELDFFDIYSDSVNMAPVKLEKCKKEQNK